MSYIRDLLLNNPVGCRGDVTIMENLILDILKERGLSALPDSPHKRINILSEAKQRYT